MNTLPSLITLDFLFPELIKRGVSCLECSHFVIDDSYAECPASAIRFGKCAAGKGSTSGNYASVMRGTANCSSKGKWFKRLKVIESKQNDSDSENKQYVWMDETDRRAILDADKVKEKEETKNGCTCERL